MWFREPRLSQPKRAAPIFVVSRSEIRQGGLRLNLANSAPFQRRENMNLQSVNVDYCGVVILLRQLVQTGKCTEREARKIATESPPNMVLISFFAPDFHYIL